MRLEFDVEELVQRADAALGHDLCDHCLGRLFAQRGTGMTNVDRGRQLRAAVNALRDLEGRTRAEHDACWVCEDVFDMTPRFADAALEAIGDIEYDTFLVGTRIDPQTVDREERLWSEVGGDDAEPIKAELNREVGKLMYRISGREASGSSPDVVTVIDTRFASVELDISPLFVYGRYRKLSREIPQTRWPCRRCRGKGCEHCNGTGRMYPTSVQDEIGDPLMEMVDGEDHFFHGMGREDIDARMMGTGRPFVIEIRRPRRRHPELSELEMVVGTGSNGTVEVQDLRPSSRKEVRELKAAAPNKTYRATVRVEGKVNKGRTIEVIRSFRNRNITQRTPSRVAHRRADLDRVREIVDVVLEDAGDDTMTLLLETQSGTYVKEFVSGDEGRTQPNLSEELGQRCEVVALDVITIHD